MPIDQIILTRIKANDPTLTSLDLSYQQLALADIQQLVDAFVNNTYIQTLDISDNILGSQGGELVANILHLKTLMAINCQLRDVGASVFGKNTMLQSLVLTDNGITAEGGKALALNKALTYLDLTGNQLGDEGAIALSENTALLSLILCRNKITTKGAIALAKNNVLIMLNISYNLIQADVGAAFAQNTGLKTLLVAGNNIGTQGIVALAKNQTLTSLDVSYNIVDDAGAIELAKHPQLMCLDLSYNQIGSLGAKALGNNKILKTLLVSYNQFGDGGAKDIAGHPSLTKLDLTGNQVGHAGAYALRHSKNLDSLNLSYNLLGDSGAVVLSGNKNLTKLFLGYNQIGDVGARAFALAGYSFKIMSNDIEHGEAKPEKDKLYIKLGINSFTYITFFTAQLEAITQEELGTKNPLTLDILDSLKYKILEITSQRGHTPPKLEVLNLNYNQISEEGRAALVSRKFPTLIISEEQPPEFTADNLDIIFLLSDSFLCITSLQENIQYFNPAFSRVLGYSSDELLSKPLSKLLHPDDISKYQQSLKEEVGGHIPIKITNQLRCKDGSYRLIHWTSKNKGNRFYSIGTDITEKKQSELDFIEAEKRNAWLRLKESEAFVDEQTQFIAHLAHEVRNPLSAILGLMELLSDEVSDLEEIFNRKKQVKKNDEVREKLTSMKSHLNEMEVCLKYQTDILNDNLDAEKINANKLTLRKDAFDLVFVIENSIRMQQSKAKEKGLVLSSRLPEKLLVKGDKIRLTQILINLIVNAVKFTSKGSIDIELLLQAFTADSIVVQINVIDTGIGLSPEELPTLFQRFSQAVGHEYDGSGLGLYLMKKLAQLMRGDIFIQSEKGKGSTFSVKLTFDQLTLEEIEQFDKITAEAKMMIALASTSPKVIVGKHKVLVVEDNMINRKIIINHLVNAGYDHEFVINGAEALKLIANPNKTFNIILMDILMPVMDGITATMEIRKREEKEKLPRIPIIALSANTHDDDIQRAIAAGVNAYITKPVTKDILLSTIAKYIGTKAFEFIPSASPTTDISPDGFTLLHEAKVVEVHVSSITAAQLGSPQIVSLYGPSYSRHGLLGVSGVSMHDVKKDSTSSLTYHR